MQLHGLDISIIIAYLVVIVIAGLILSRRAGQNIDIILCIWRQECLDSVGLANV